MMKKPKHILNKDGSRDLILSKKYFDDNFIVGCLMQYNSSGKSNSKVIVRVYGSVPNLKYAVLNKKKGGK